tara:strand:- start:3736 stop:4713 length:978 start_codon:yes stop_codon:yes gene_type:complete
VNKVARTVLSLAIAIAVVGLLLWWAGIRPDAVTEALGRLDAKVYAFTFAVHLATLGCRVGRFSSLLDDSKPKPFTRLLEIVMVHNLFAFVLPAKVGDASLPLFLKRYQGRRVAEGAMVLAVSRLLDLACVVGTISITCLVVGTAGNASHAWMTQLGLVLVPLTIVFAWLCFQGERLVGMVQWFTRTIRLDRTKLGEKAMGFAVQLREAFASLERRQLLGAALWTLPLWFLVFLFWATLARALGLDILTPAEAFFGSGLSILAAQLPINGFASFGSLDLAWAFGFKAMGATEAAAVSSGIATHLVSVFNVVLLGLVGQALLGRRRD